MSQASFSEAEFAARKRIMRREERKDLDVDSQLAMKRSKLRAIPQENNFGGPLPCQLESVKAINPSRVKHSLSHRA